MSNKNSSAFHTIFRPIVGGFVVVAVMFSNLFVSTPAYAQLIVGEPVVAANTTKDQVYEKTMKDVFLEGAVIALVSGVNYFASQLAYSLAVSLTSECPGQKVCWDSKGIKEGWTQAWQGAIGESIGSLSAELGLDKYGLNLCNPDPRIMMQLQIGLLDNAAPTTKCNLNDIVNNYQSLGNEIGSGEFLNRFQFAFTPGSAPISMSLNVLNGLYDDKILAEQVKQTQLFQDAAAGGGFSALKDAVSGRVTAPAESTRMDFQRLHDQKSGKDAEDKQTQISAGQIASRAALSVVINATQTFAQTVISRLWNRFAEGLLSTEELVAADPDFILDPESLLNPGRAAITAAIAPRFENIAANPRETGVTDMVLLFSSCPPKDPLPMNCVMDSDFAQITRLSQATPLTVREAVQRNLLHGERTLIPASNPALDQNSQCYVNSYCESNLKKLRAARIVPVGWEMAAAVADTNTTLQQVIDAFDDCPVPGGSAGSKFCHMIDPDWVIKAPTMQCHAAAYGPTLVSSQIATRNEECVDYQSCLAQDDAGKCTGGYGYCLKEKRVWRFNGDQCPVQFNTCTKYQDSQGTDKMYVANTVDTSSCNADNAGCNAYATERSSGRCDLKDLSGAIKNCDSDKGCACEGVAFTCKVSSGLTRCKEVSTGSFCDLGYQCSAVNGCDCTVKSTCTVAVGAHSCTTSSGGPQEGDDWRPESSIFMNGKAQDCDPGNDGCTAVIPLSSTSGANFLRNPSFEELDDVNDDGTPDHAKYWTPTLPAPSGKSGSLILDPAKAVDGQNSILVGTPTSNDTCVIPADCTDNTGKVFKPCNIARTCTKDLGGSPYSCLVPAGANSCRVMSYPGQWVPFKANTTYTMAASFVPVSGVAVSAEMSIGGITTSSGDDVGIIAANRIFTSVSLEGFETGAVGNCFVGSGTSPSAAKSGIVLTVKGNRKAGAKSVRASCSFSYSNDVALQSAFYRVYGDSATTPMNVDSVYFGEGTDGGYKDGYGSQVRQTYVKVAPDSMRCSGGAGDVEACKNYALTCRVNEIGCDSYTPTLSGPAVPGIVTPQDRCPAECSGYDTFKQERSSFESEKFPQFFIPGTAKACAAEDVGCAQFTDVETEKVAYFSRLRACVPANDSLAETFYSWEGSDTVGYQLRTWRARKTESAAVSGTTNDVCATGGTTCTLGSAPCTVLDGTSLNCASVDSGDTAGKTDGLCTRADIDGGDLDCRELYDAQGNLHYRRESMIVFASSTCNSYRITDVTQADCVFANGRWEELSNRCFFVADPTSSRVCPVAANGCRAYKGNASTNIRTIVEQDFESTLSGWTGESGSGTVASPFHDLALTSTNTDDLSISTESVNVGGHSLKINTSGAARYEVGGIVAPLRSYTLEFWARGTGTMAINFKNGTLPVSCTLPSACPSTSTAGCACATATGLKCIVAVGQSVCAVPLSTVEPVAAASAQSTLVSTYFADGSATTIAPNINLTSDWRRYSLGPVAIDLPTGNNAPWGSASVKLRFNPRGQCTGGADAGAQCSAGSQCASGACQPSGDVYIDNVVLREVQDQISVVKNSWKTPVSCDTTSTGIGSLQEMLGCREYRTRLGTTEYLRSFNRLCREQAIGCQAFADTQGTKEDPRPRTYGAVCALASGATCTDAMGCSCGMDILGQPYRNVCTVRNLEKTCRFDLEGRTQVSPADNESYTVNEDRIRYLVVRDQDRCPATEASCRVIAVPKTKMIQRECTSPVAPSDCVDGTMCVCLDGLAGAQNQALWAAKWVSRTNKIPTRADLLPYANCYQNETQKNTSKFCTITFSDPIPASWEETAKKLDAENYGSLRCGASAVGCQAFKTAKGKTFFKDPGQKVCEYVENAKIAQLSPAGTTVSGWFIKGTEPQLDTRCAVGPNVDQALIDVNGTPSCTLTAGKCSLQPTKSCSVAQPCGDDDYGNAQTCISDSLVCTDPLGGCKCQSPDGNVCFVNHGQRSCGYDGWVGSCPAQFDKCEEFVDPNDTAANEQTSKLSAGRTYYYINDSRIDGNACNGQVSLDNGCVLFNQTSNPQQLFSSKETYKASDLNNGDPVSPVRGTDPNTNRILKVRLDRQCTEWLACSSYTPVTNDTTKKIQRRCNELRTCLGNKAGSADFFSCQKWGSIVPPEEVRRLTPELYAKRGDSMVCKGGTKEGAPCSTNATCGGGTCSLESKINWGDDEYSGYSIPNTYPLTYLRSYEMTDFASGDFNGLCKGVNGAPKGTPCNTDDECVNDGGKCISSYFAKRRYDVVLDPNAKCTNGESCPAVGDGVAGLCINAKCFYSFDGGPISSQATGTAPQCRAYPEVDSPFPTSVVDGNSPGVGNGGFDASGQPIAKLQGYEGANICVNGEVCECTYKRYDYGQLSRFTGVAGATIGSICVGGNLNGQACPGTETGTTGANGASSECRKAGGQCSKPKRIATLNGWAGLCVDQDKSRIVANNGIFGSGYACNLWLPVDQLEGAVDVDGLHTEAGFHLPEPQDQDLLYCAIGKGMSNYGDNNGRDYVYEVPLEFNSNESDLNDAIYWSDNDEVVHTNDGEVNVAFSGQGLRSGTSYIEVELETWASKDRKIGSDEVGRKFRPKFILYEGNNWSACKGGGFSKSIDGILGRDVEVLGDGKYPYYGNSSKEDNCGGSGKHLGVKLNNEPAWEKNFILTVEDKNVNNFNGDCIQLFADEYDLNETALEIGLAAIPGAELAFAGCKLLSGIHSHTRIVSVKAHMRDWCVAVERVTDLSKNNDTNAVSSVAWTDRLFKSWSGGGKSKGYDFEHKLDKSMGNIEPTLIDGHDEMGPFGRIRQEREVTAKIITFKSESESEIFPENVGPLQLWPSEGGSPNGGPFITCKQGGVVVYGDKNDSGSNGIGKCECKWPNNDGADTCTWHTGGGAAASGIPFACDGDCDYAGAGLKNWNTGGKAPLANQPYSSDAEKTSATNLSELFVHFFGTYDQTSSDMFRYDLSANPEFNDRRGNHLADGSQPVILKVNAQKCSFSVDGLCGEAGPGMTINDVAGSGDVVLQGAGRSQARIKFYMYADKDHMPIREKRISFGDDAAGNRENPGWYKNRRGCTANATCYQPADGICEKGDEWGKTPDSCESSYIEEVHNYECTQEIYNGLPDCPAAGQETLAVLAKGCKKAGKCAFKPRVQIIDNWGVCNGTCPTGKQTIQGKDICFNSDANFVNESTAYQPETHECAPLDSSFAGGDKPWTAYAGYILLAPSASGGASACGLGNLCGSSWYTGRLK